MAKRATRKQQASAIETVLTTQPIQPTQTIQPEQTTVQSVVQPVVQTEITKVEPKPKQKKVKEPKNPNDITEEKQIHKKLGIFTIPSRIRHLMDDEGMNKEVNAELKKIEVKVDEYNKYKHQLNYNQIYDQEEYKEVVTVEKNGVKVEEEVTKTRSKKRELTDDERKRATAEIKKFEETVDYEKYEALKKKKFRFGKEAPIALAVLFDKIVEEIVKKALSESAKDTEKHKVKVSTFFKSDYESLPLYNLYKSLPTFEKFRKEFSEAAFEEKFREKMDKEMKALAEKHKEEIKLSKAQVKQLEKSVKGLENKLRKAENKEKSQPDQVTEQKPEVEQKPAKEQKPEKPKKEKSTEKKAKETLTFESGCKAIVDSLHESNGAYKGLRISREVYEFLDSLLKDFVFKTIFVISQNLQSSEVRTISLEHVEVVIKTIAYANIHYKEVISLEYETVPAEKALEEEKKKLALSKEKRKEEKKKGVDSALWTKVHTFNPTTLPQEKRLVAKKTTVYAVDPLKEVVLDTERKLEKFRTMQVEDKPKQ